VIARSTRCGTYFISEGGKHPPESTEEAGIMSCEDFERSLSLDNVHSHPAHARMSKINSKAIFRNPYSELILCNSHELHPNALALDNSYTSESSISSLPLLVTTSLISSLKSSPTSRLSDMISLALSSSHFMSSMINFMATSGTTTYST